MTAHTKVPVDAYDPVLVSLIDGAGGTDHQAWGIPTVEAGKGEKGEACVRMISLFQAGHVNETPAVAGEIVFVLASNDTGHTTATARNIEGKT